MQLLSSGPEPADVARHRALPHVLLVVDGFPKALGGGERVVLRLASLLPQYGFRASILTFTIHPQSSFQPGAAPCPVYLLPLTRTYGLEALRGALALRRLLREQDIRIVQTFFESSDLWAGLVTRLASRAKLIWSRRDMGILRGRKHDLAYRALRRLPHAVFAVSQRVADHVIYVDRVPPGRVHVIHNGLDLKPLAVSTGSPQRSAPVITTIGNIRRVKGHDLLLRTAPAILAKFPQATFTIAGEVLEPEFFAELESMARDLQLSNHVRFLGKVTDLQAHLQSATLFVLPSRSEGFSNALIEAMAVGLPAIATDVGGNAEAIKDGKNGLIVPPEDSTALTAAILRVLEHPEFAQQLSIAARHTVKTDFTADAMMRKLTSAYRSVLER